jgi:Protein of unknown function (DUF3147)
MVTVKLSSLKDGRWYEYLIRFVLGGAATVTTGLIAKIWGPEIGGLFLALPAMLCASATMVESHERRHKQERGLSGTKRGEDAAALDAAGAAVGSIALMVFGSAVYFWIPTLGWVSLPLALAVWTCTSLLAWWIYKRAKRIAHHHRRRNRRLRARDNPRRGRSGL